MANPNKRHITILIDRSGSMRSIQQATEEGLNSFIAAQAKEDIETLLTIYQFDHDFGDHPFFEVVCENTPIGEVPVYTLEPRHGTALLDAMYETFTRARNRRKALPKNERPGVEHYLIVTDGEENSSRHHTYPEVAKLVAEESERKGRIVQYMGANQDAIATASKLGIQRTNAISYAASNLGTRGTWEAASATASAGARGLDHSYTPDMRAKTMGEEAREE